MLVAFAFAATRKRTQQSNAVFALRLPSSVSGSPSSPPTTWELASLLNSRLLAEAVVDALQLTVEREGARHSQAVRKLQDKISINVNDRDGIVDFEQQFLLVQAHAAVVEQIRALTVELTSKRMYLPDSDPEVQQLVSRLNELERQRLTLEHGHAGTARRQLRFDRGAPAVRGAAAPGAGTAGAASEAACETPLRGRT